MITPNDFQTLCMRSAPDEEQNKKIALRLAQEPELIHAILGIMDEVGENAKTLKHNLIYGKSFDRDNILEENGDKLWYIVLELSACGFTLEDCMNHVIEKLKIRYPEKFTEQDAIERKDKKI